MAHHLKPRAHFQNAGACCQPRNGCGGVAWRARRIALRCCVRRRCPRPYRILHCIALYLLRCIVLYRAVSRCPYFVRSGDTRAPLPHGWIAVICPALYQTFARRPSQADLLTQNSGPTRPAGSRLALLRCTGPTATLARPRCNTRIYASLTSASLRGFVSRWGNCPLTCFCAASRDPTTKLVSARSASLDWGRRRIFLSR